MTIYQDSFVFFFYLHLGGAPLKENGSVRNGSRVPGPGALKYFTHQETHKATH